MTATAHVLGHPIAFDGEWRYADTGEPVLSAPDRACVSCGLFPTAEGHDPCLGTIPGATSACCGHGVGFPFILRG
jgi:hypothetical protein